MNFRHFVVWLLVALVFLSLMNRSAAAQGQDFIARAKGEGEVTLYTSMSVSDTEIVMNAFRKKFPFLLAKGVRMNNERIPERILTEQRAGQHFADVVASDTTQILLLKERNALERYESPEKSFVKKSWSDTAGFWTTIHKLVYVIGYNTNLVAQDAPADYSDLLHPRWRGRLAMDPEEYQWFYSLMQAWGRKSGLEFMKNLAAHAPQFRKGHTLLTQLLVAGEFPIAVAVYQNRVDQFRSKQAPVQWVQAKPLISTEGNSVALLKSATHPYAARLLIDFLLGEDGQKVLRDTGRIVARQNLPSLNPLLDKLEIHGGTIPTADYNQVVKEFNDIFRPYAARR